MRRVEAIAGLVAAEQARADAGRIAALAEAVRASAGALRAKEAEFAAGLNTNIEVLDAQRALFSAERDYLKERYDYVLEILQLEALIGNLDSDDLRRVNAWLN